MLNFWSDETRLPIPTIDRAIALLSTLYSPLTESNFLSYSTYLLLEMTSKSPDYNKEIFKHPLSDCKFEVIFADYTDIHSHYRHTLYVDGCLLGIATSVLHRSRVLQNYEVNCSWRTRHSTLVPLFVDTVPVSSGTFTDQELSSQPGMLRATQENLLFTPTQDAGKFSVDELCSSSSLLVII